jgi:hypothetical protein
VSEASDPILERRSRIRRFVEIAQRVGYSAMAFAVVVFGVGAASGFPGWSVVVTIVALALSIVILPVPIVLGYGVRAAEREERAQRPDAP